jgi:hypothetical protein
MQPTQEKICSVVENREQNWTKHQALEEKTIQILVQLGNWGAMKGLGLLYSARTLRGWIS